MKIRYTLLSVFAICGAALFMANSNGSTLGDLTGAPGSNGTCANCHGNLNNGTGITLSGLPNEYMPGQTYTITVTLDNPTNRNGFQFTLRDANNVTPGSFTAGTGNNVKGSGGRSSVQHSQPNGSGSWSFDWTAPASDAGNLTMYVTGNATDGDGGTNGDQVYSITQTLNSAQPSSAVSLKEEAFRIFPVNNHSGLQIEGINESKEYAIVNLSGQLVDQGVLNPNEILDVSSLNNGYFFLKVINNGEQLVRPFVKP